MTLNPPGHKVEGQEVPTLPAAMGQALLGGPFSTIFRAFTRATIEPWDPRDPKKNLLATPMAFLITLRAKRTLEDNKSIQMWHLKPLRTAGNVLMDLLVPLELFGTIGQAQSRFLIEEFYRSFKL